MAIPDYQTCMLPLLKHYGDGQEHTNRDSIDALAKEFKLTDEERRMMLPSGVQGLFDNRVNWARTYMKKAALIESPKRGVHKITKRGHDILKKKPERIDVAYLGQFQEFKRLSRASTRQGEDRGTENSTSATRRLRNRLRALTRSSVAI